MWSFDSLAGKAQLYFGRAQDHPRADDEEFALWLLLGLEFLMRAPLARVNPTLLADPQHGDSILHAAGFPNPKADASEPKSIPTHTVISRLSRVVEGFTKERATDATILMALRNSELHTGLAPLAGDISTWLPRFMRVAEILFEHLELSAADQLGDEIVALGRELVDAEDSKLTADVRKRIEAARAFFYQLKEVEVAARRAKIPKVAGRDLPPFIEDAVLDDPSLARLLGPTERISCPSCGEAIPPRLESIRTTNERLEEDQLFRDVVYIVRGLNCPVCHLQLSGTAEVKSAGIQQQFVRQEVESLEERYGAYYEGYEEYGND